MNDIRNLNSNVDDVENDGDYGNPTPHGMRRLKAMLTSIYKNEISAIWYHDDICSSHMDFSELSYAYCDNRKKVYTRTTTQ